MKLKILIFTCFIILIISCEKESALDKYYNQEGNFSGSIYDALDSAGLYNYFIHGIDSTDFGNQLKNTLVTVIAPSDRAFKAYLEKYGYESLSSIPKDILQDLIGHHVITWPHSPSSFEIDLQFYFPEMLSRFCYPEIFTLISYILSFTYEFNHSYNRSYS